MGLFKDKHPSDAHDTEQIQKLKPLEPPLEVFHGYAHKEQVLLSFERKVFNVKEDTLDVKDDNGNIVVKITGSPFFITHFKSKPVVAQLTSAISDPHGHVLFNMRSRPLSWTRNFICEAEGEGSTEYFYIQQRVSLGLMLDASTMPATGPTQSLHLVGGFEGFDAQVTDDNGNVVAAFWEKRHVLENRQSYHCNVAAGVDLAVISALCLAWDKCKEDDKGHSVMLNSIPFTL